MLNSTMITSNDGVDVWEGKRFIVRPHIEVRNSARSEMPERLSLKRRSIALLIRSKRLIFSFVAITNVTIHSIERTGCHLASKLRPFTGFPCFVRAQLNRQPFL